MHDSLSSEGELSDIANRERSRSMMNKTRRSVRTMIESELTSSCLLSDWPGEYQFSLGLPEYTRARDPQYSNILNKLYICQNSSVTVKLS